MDIFQATYYLLVITGILILVARKPLAGYLMLIAGFSAMGIYDLLQRGGTLLFVGDILIILVMTVRVWQIKKQKHN